MRRERPEALVSHMMWLGACHPSLAQSRACKHREFYNTPEAKTIVRRMLRYQRLPEFIKALINFGYLDASEKEFVSGLTWAEATQKATSAADATAAYVPRILLLADN